MISKKHIARITQMVRRADEYEERMAKIYGARTKGGGRTSYWQDTQALRAVLAPTPTEEPQP